MKIYLIGRLLRDAEKSFPFHAVKSRYRHVPYRTAKDEHGYYVEGDARLAEELGAKPTGEVIKQPARPPAPDPHDDQKNPLPSPKLKRAS